MILWVFDFVRHAHRQVDKITIGFIMLAEKEATERRDFYRPNPRDLASQTALRAMRDNEKVQTALNKLREYARKHTREENNLVP